MGRTSESGHIGAELCRVSDSLIVREWYRHSQAVLRGEFSAVHTQHIGRTKIIKSNAKLRRFFVCLVVVLFIGSYPVVLRSYFLPL